jgi:glutathione S-transferase
VPLTEHHDFDSVELKPQAPFGQFPLMDDGDFRLAQSGAILRYIAAKGNLDGRDNLKDYGNNEMFLEEYTDMYNLLVKANYDPEGRHAGFDKAFEFEGSMRRQLDKLEILISDGSFGTRVLSGDCKYKSILL